MNLIPALNNANGVDLTSSQNKNRKSKNHRNIQDLLISVDIYKFSLH